MYKGFGLKPGAPPWHAQPKAKPEPKAKGKFKAGLRGSLWSGAKDWKGHFGEAGPRLPRGKQAPMSARERNGQAGYAHQP
eukprot:5639723-Pyramimonas_sp.AAC.1